VETKDGGRDGSDARENDGGLGSYEQSFRGDDKAAVRSARRDGARGLRVVQGAKV
jgi:hypothetical protein